MMTVDSGLFAATAVALYAGHHVGDYWVQTDREAKEKGLPGWRGRLACLSHVLTYMATQYAMLLLLALTTGIHGSSRGAVLAITVSGVTHYLADRREHGLMIWLARRIPGKAAFLKLGVPRDATDNPQLATGGWALDQSWHIFWGVFVAAIVAVVV